MTQDRPAEWRRTDEERRTALYRVLITGSRDWLDIGAIERELDALLDKHWALILMHGACPTGADAIADAWARSKDTVLVMRYHALWNKHGRAAGPIRNLQMVEAGPDECLAFIKDNSAGASHCASSAQRAGIPTRIQRQETPIGVS